MLTRRKTILIIFAFIAQNIFPLFTKRAFAKMASPKTEVNKTLTAIVDRIIPSHAGGGGALALGVHKYIWEKINLGGKENGKLLSAIEGVIKESLRRFGKTFSELDTKKQITFLKEVSSGAFYSSYVTSRNAKNTFITIRNLTAEKYYSDSRVFGSIGFDGPSQYKGHPDYDQWPQT